MRTKIRQQAIARPLTKTSSLYLAIGFSAGTIAAFLTALQLQGGLAWTASF
ncbi:MAG: hypothetical protein O7C63_00090 [Alphaproteobacteria bacterium]|nr:hypothetical protein [Alphaproteobacteria bacterium]MCZ6763312.1 hypothetical protein [Alphaproteobacteria bacterium]